MNSVNELNGDKESETQIQMSEVSRAAFESEISSKDREISRLVEDLQSARVGIENIRSTFFSFLEIKCIYV